MTKLLILISAVLPVASVIAGCGQKNEPQTRSEETEQQSAEQQELEQAPDEMLSAFSVSGYARDGEKQWDLSGNSADIMSSEIKLQDVTGKVYGKNSNMTIVADEGSLDRLNNNVHLEKNVLATTDDGATLTTDYLDWDAQSQELFSEARVWLKKEEMEASGTGIMGQPLLNFVQLRKDVAVKITPQPDLASAPGAVPTVITCSGTLDVNYQENLAVFHDNVQVNDKRGEIFADKIDVYFTSEGEDDGQIKAMGGLGIDKLVAAGNVEIHHSGNISYSEKAVYDTATGKLTLYGRPKLVIYSPAAFSQAFGASKNAGEERATEGTVTPKGLKKYRKKRR